MTPTFIRPAIALALALALAGCGGGKASFPINGTVSGLTYSGLVLTTNGMDLAVAPAQTQFRFANSLSYGDGFNVTVKTQPAHQTCTILNGGNDSAGHTAAINVVVQCSTNAAAIGGTISGLTSNGLVLTNGSTGGSIAPAAGSTTFTLPSVQFNVTYGVTVATQPANDVCSVSPNGTGVMTDAAITDIAVTCVPK
jgi:RNase P/RNase MRP subunit p29